MKRRQGEKGRNTANGCGGVEVLPEGTVWSINSVGQAALLSLVETGSSKTLGMHICVPKLVGVNHAAKARRNTVELCQWRTKVIRKQWFEYDMQTTVKVRREY